MKSRGIAWRRGGRASLGLLLLPLLVACHPKVTRLAAQGRFDEAIEHAESRRWEARGKSARAYARALVERGRIEDARDVLFRDFRRGQQFESLDALASLELRVGARGLAGVHFARLMELDHPRVEGREEVCQLFRERARAHLAEGEPIAADQDLRRVYELCGEPDEASLARADRDLAERIAPLAAERAQALRRLEGRIEGPPTRRAEREEAFADARSAARGAGWSAYGAWAAAEGAQLEPSEIVAILLDEFDDPGRERLFDGETIDGWIGPASINHELLSGTALTSFDDAQLAYLRLRLAPLAARRGEAELAGLDKAPLEVALEASGMDPLITTARAWKGLLLTDQLQAAELVLSTWLRSTEAQPEAQLSTGGEERSSAETASAAPVAPWWKRVQVHEGTLGAWMVLGRLREARGESQGSLELWASLGDRGVDADALEAQMLGEALRQLRRGEPWRAMALADGLSLERKDALWATAETQLALLELLCAESSEGCSLSDMRNEAARVMGEEWARERERAMTVQRPSSTPDWGGCGQGAEVLTGGPDTALGMLIALGGRAPTVEQGRELSRRLVDEIEGDLTMGCHAHIRVELLDLLVADLDLERLNERMTQSTVQRSSALLETKAILALASGLGERAWEFTRAAAADAAEPEGVYRRAAERGRQRTARNFELSARLRLAALEPGARTGADSRAVLAIRFADLFRSDLLGRDWEVAVDAWRHDFEMHLAAWPEGERWGESRRIARSLWTQAPEDAELAGRWREELSQLLGPTAVAGLAALPPDGAGDLLAGRVARTHAQSVVGAITVGSLEAGEETLVSLLDELVESGRHGTHEQLVGLFVLGGTAITQQGRTRPLLGSSDRAWRLAFGLR